MIKIMKKNPNDIGNKKSIVFKNIVKLSIKLKKVRLQIKKIYLILNCF
jgi:hypothetical protein